MLGDNYAEEGIGSEKLQNPFLKPAPKAILPGNLGWVDGLYKELSENFLRRMARAIRRTMQPLYQFPPFQHTVIDMLEVATVAAGAAGTILTLNCPENEIARIRFYGQDITPVIPPLPGTEWNEVRWTFRVNNVPLEYYDNFLYQRGAQLFPAETTIILEDADIFTITAQNNSAANAYNCWAFIRGWRYSKLITRLADENMLTE